MILKHILDNSLPYSFYEIYSETHLKKVLDMYKISGNFQESYQEYDRLLQEKIKKRKAKKK